MRKIEENMIQAINNLQDYNGGNTTVSIGKKYILVHLFGNMIFAQNRRSKKVQFSSCGWSTQTTVSRLRALGCDCRIKDGVLLGVSSNRIKLRW